MPKKVASKFEKGVNDRFDITKGDSNRLNKLQNARISQRGSTHSVSRIEGYVSNDILPAGEHRILHMIFGTRDDLFVYWTQDNGDNHIWILDVFDFSNILIVEQFNLGTLNLKQGWLVQQQNTIFISPLNKMINLVQGEYFLNDVIADYPKFKQATVG